LHYFRQFLVIVEVLKLHGVQVEDIGAEVKRVMKFIEAEVGVLEEKADDWRVIDLVIAVRVMHGSQCISGDEFDVL
jgi:hypothetical protein